MLAPPDTSKTLQHPTKVDTRVQSDSRLLSSPQAFPTVGNPTLQSRLGSVSRLRHASEASMVDEVAEARGRDRKRGARARLEGRFDGSQSAHGQRLASGGHADIHRLLVGVVRLARGEEVERLFVFGCLGVNFSHYAGLTHAFWAHEGDAAAAGFALDVAMELLADHLPDGLLLGCRLGD